MGPAISIDQRTVAAQPAGRDSVLSVFAGNPQNRLYAQRHREPEHESAQDHQDAGRVRNQATLTETYTKYLVIPSESVLES
jgi:hypothetical protein